MVVGHLQMSRGAYYSTAEVLVVLEGLDSAGTAAASVTPPLAASHPPPRDQQSSVAAYTALLHNGMSVEKRETFGTRFQDWDGGGVKPQFKLKVLSRHSKGLNWPH